MSCRRMLSVEDRAAIMVGVEAGLSQVRIGRSIGCSPSVVCREIARHRGPGGVYKAQEARRVAQVVRRCPKKRLLDRDEVVRRRVIADLSQGRTPRQISAPPERGGMWHSGSYAQFSPRLRPHDQPRGSLHVDRRPPQQDADRARHVPALQAMDAQEAPCRRAHTTHCRHAMNRLKRPDIADRMIPGNWEGDLIIGKDGASACATLVERTTRYLIIVALPPGSGVDQVCNLLTRRTQGLPEGAMRTLTWNQGSEMARHQRLTPGTGVEVFFVHPHSPWGRGSNDNTN